MLFYLLFYILCTALLLAGTHSEIRRYEKALLFFIIVMMWLLVSFSQFVGPDYEAYQVMYDAINSDLLQQEFMFRAMGEWLSYRGYSFHLLYFIITSLYFLMLYYIFERYRNYLVLNILIFIIMPYGLYEGGFTYIRQNVAIAIFFLSLVFIVENKPIKYVFCGLIAMLFHKSAAMVLPLYFIARRKISSKVSLVIYLIVLVFTLLLSVSAFRHLVFSAIALIPVYGKTYLNFRGGEFLTPVSTKGVLSYIYQVIPLVMLMIYRDRLVRTEIENVLYNLTFLSLLTLTLALQMRILLRIEYYFIIAKVFSLPLLLRLYNTRQHRMLALLVLIGYFSIYFIALYFTGEEKNIFPYRTLFGFEV